MQEGFATVGIAELLPEGMTLDDWQAETQRLIASGAAGFAAFA